MERVIVLNLAMDVREDQSLVGATHNINEEINNITEKRSISEGGEGEETMVPPVGNSIHRSSSRPQLDLSGAAIQGNFEERDPTILLPNQSDDISHLALDIGGDFCSFNVGFDDSFKRLFLGIYEFLLANFLLFFEWVCN